MKRKRSHHSKTYESPKQSVWARLPLRQIGIVGGVLILIGTVLFLKARKSPGASVEPVAQISPTPSDPEDSASPVEPTAEATDTTPPSPTPDMLPEAQLDRLLEAGEPVFLFFHSNTCAQCVKMSGIVEDVYPDFSDSVALIDVDVYNEQNRDLLQRANIRAIPTLIFIDREGEAQGQVGVMEPDALREQLQQLAEE